MTSSTAITIGYSKDFYSTQQSSQTFIVQIRPAVSGIIPIKIEAAGQAGGRLVFDSIEKYLNVIPEGIERVVTNTVLLLKEGSAMSVIDISCTVPNTVDPATVSVHMTFVGDLLGDALKNVANLLQLPNGCGEQNLARFATTIAVHNYLSASGRLTEAVHNTIYEYVRQGLVKHLTLRTSAGC